MHQCLTWKLDNAILSDIWLDYNQLQGVLIDSEPESVNKSNYHTPDDLAYIIQVH